MTNKEYKAAREIHESASEKYNFEHYNGFSFYPSPYMTSNDQKELRKEYKTDKSAGAFSVPGMTNKAVIIPVDGGFLLKSYYTTVAGYVNGTFYKLWEGYSVTTMKHINAFREYLNLSILSKREWIEKPTVEVIVNSETGELIAA